MKIFITGISGSGKTTISRKLIELGYEAYDIEHGYGLFTMVDIRTKKPFVGHTNDDAEVVKHGKWICDPEKLAALMAQQKNETAFYCGTASNTVEELWPLFDKIIVLQASPKKIRERLSTRKPGDFGHAPAVQDWVLSWKDWWEDKMREHGAVFINADRTLDEIVAEILKESNIKAL